MGGSRRAGSLDNKWNAREIREGAGNGCRGSQGSSLSWIGSDRRKAPREGGVERKDERDPSRPWKKPSVSITDMT